MLGCAFSGDTYPDRPFGRSLTEAEIRSALDWLAPRIRDYRITFDMITDHRQVSPGRKDDLNPVEWAKLQARIKQRFFS
jgi:AmpD protein